MMQSIRFHHLFIAAIVIAGSACTQFGPKMIGPAGFNYNEAMATTWNQQLLLNLVRLHYHEPPFFLEASSVVTGYTFSGDVNADADLGRAGGLDDTLGFDGGIAYAERPTITYQPLTGEAFTKKMLTPIAPETLILLARSGWSVKTIILALVQEINGLNNPRSHIDATVNSAQSFRPITRVATLLNELQQTGELTLEVAAESGNESRLIIQGYDSPKAREVRQLLSLPADVDDFEITRLRVRDPNQISIIGRSLLDALQYLSQAVDSPENHRERTGALGQKQIPPGLFTIKSRALRPTNAFVKVRHHGRWFYVDERDVPSKELMGLLTQLFSLQATGGGGRSPLLTIPQ